MRTIHLTAGTGNFYCGSCMRDNQLVRAMRRRGHDAHMLSLYLPSVLDQEAADPKAPIFFGGINVYLQQRWALFRKLPRWADRVLDRPGLLRWLSNRASMTQPAELGELTISMLRGEEGNQRKEIDRLVQWLQGHERVDVVSLSSALLLGLARPLRDALGAPVVGTLQGEDFFLDSLPEPQRSRAWEELSKRAREADALFATSRYYAQVMVDRLGLAADAIEVIHNGIDLSGYEPAPHPPEAPTIGYLARLCPNKGLGTLADAFILLKADESMAEAKLRLAGTKTPADEAFIAQTQRRFADAGVDRDVTWHVNLTHEQKLAFLRELTVLSVPTTYGEAFGLYVIEAMASGVPVVQPRHASFPELVAATDGGVLCEPDDPQSLADQLKSLLLDPQRARSIGTKGLSAVRERFTVDHMAQQVLELFEKVARQPA